MLYLLVFACPPPSVDDPDPWVEVVDTPPEPDTEVRFEVDSFAWPGASADPLSVDEDAVRFVALGDGGLGNRGQFEVGGAVADVCTRNGCDFALYLGDNFYGLVPTETDAP